jgi:hypothetical protein
MIFPFATVETLDEELAATDRALDRLGEGFVVDELQRQARRRRLRVWRERIVEQLAELRS